jgi:hypothetical protein
VSINHREKDIKMQTKSNVLSVKKKIQDHILAHYNPREYGVRSKTSALKMQVQAVSDRSTPTDYHRGLKLAQNGEYLISYYDKRKYLESLNINPKNKKFDDYKVDHTYNHLIAREIDSLTKKGKK